MLIRPALSEDVAALAELAATSYYELDLRTFARDRPDPVFSDPTRRSRWSERAAAVIASDPRGCWVAEVDGRVAGFALSRIREQLWILSSFAVAPALQGGGIGFQLLAATLQYGRGCLRGMFAASADPKAVRRYRLAGFDLYPQMFLSGVVDRTAIPVLERARPGRASDLDLLNSIDRQRRGSAHGEDHALLQRHFRLAVIDDSRGSGYAYVADSGSATLLAASNRRTACELLWEALATAPPDQRLEIHHITSANLWAIDVGLAAGLGVHQSGYLCLRQMKPPSPYLHHGSML